MQSFKLSIIFMLFFCVSSISLGQLPSKSEVRKSNMESFQEKHNNKFSIRWDEEAGLPKSIRGHKISDYSGTPLEIAKQFLKDEKVMFGIESVDQDLVLKHIRKMSTGGSRVYFTQRHKDVKVLNTGYLVIMDANGAIYYVTGDYYPDIKLESVIPTFTSVDNLIRSDIEAGKIESITDPELFILPEAGEVNTTYILVYQSTVTTSGPFGVWEYMIDANDGSILERKSLSCDINGTGRVYKTDPDDCSYSTETLHHLDNIMPRKLLGTEVNVYNYATSEASSSTATFIYDPSNTHFDEVMSYYHCDEFKQFLITNLDMGPNQLSSDVAVYTDHYEDYATAYYTVPKIHFMDGYPYYDRLNPTKDAGVIAHEFMHCVTWTYVDINDGMMEKSMFEAYSDYFGVAYYNQHSSTSWIGQYIDDSEEYNWARNLDNSAHYSEYNTYEWDNFGTSEEHDKCQIFSGGLWDFRSDGDTDTEQADKLVLLSLEYLDDTPTFLEGREALIEACDDDGWDAYIDDVAVAFHAHGIGNGAPSVTISGPSYLPFKESAICTANVSGGNSPISYQWYKKIGQGSWTSLGTSSTQSITMGMDDITMKVVVTDNFDLTDDDTHLIETGIFKLAAGEEATLSIPDNHTVAQNYPNPFNPETQIRFGLPEDSKVTIEVFNLQGQKVATLADGYYEAGYHSVTFSGANHSSGVYFYRTVAGDFHDIKRMLLIK